MATGQGTNQHLAHDDGDTDVTTSPMGRAFRGQCMYPSTTCTAERAVKKNGAPHTLCPFHRAKHNQQQRKFDAKKRRPDRFAPYDMQAMEAATAAGAVPSPRPKRNTVLLKSELQLAFRKRLQEKHRPPSTPPPQDDTIDDTTPPTSDERDNQGGHDEAVDVGMCQRPSTPLPPLATLLRRFHESSR